ncbi:hypothetical protein ACLOJK_015302 [Asimina triloba]
MADEKNLSHESTPRLQGAYKASSGDRMRNTLSLESTCSIGAYKEHTKKGGNHLHNLYSYRTYCKELLKFDSCKEDERMGADVRC